MNIYLSENFHRITLYDIINDVIIEHFIHGNVMTEYAYVYTIDMVYINLRKNSYPNIKKYKKEYNTSIKKCICKAKKHSYVILNSLLLEI